VFIHGMLGTAELWSPMIERLKTEAAAEGRYQILTFSYDSFQPLETSARELLDALTEARRQSDPEGQDPSFDSIVLVGHSLGGLVAKSAAAGSGRKHAHTVAPQAGGKPRPSPPRVGRVIFIATPHRGASINQGAVRSMGNLVARLVSPSTSMLPAPRGANAKGPLTSVDQLTWDNPVLRDLDRVWVSTEIPSHSIVASLRDSSLDGATDGIVPVASAHLAGARSELVVRAAHICLQRTDVIREVERVLDEHSTRPARGALTSAERSMPVGARVAPVSNASPVGADGGD
jgi:pimeloyl-ACP methyl ester carboxylesterase